MQRLALAVATPELGGWKGKKNKIKLTSSPLCSIAPLQKATPTPRIVTTHSQHIEIELKQ
jgi:hypothetical protein